MNQEINGDNKPEVAADNKATEVKEPNLPNLKEEKVEQPKPQDPDYEKWAKETGNLENAYHRVKGSAAEVEKWRKEAEESKSYREKYDQISQELQFLAKSNPKLAKQIQDTLTSPPEEEPESDNKVVAELPAEDKRLLENLRFREAEEAKRTITSFRKTFQGYIQNEEQWEAIREHAKSLDGKRDINGNYYTLKTALQAAIRAEMPQVISDKATLETYASTANRDSAAEAGDTAFGRTNDVALSPEEEAMVKRFSQFGATREGYLRRKAQHS